MPYLGNEPAVAYTSTTKDTFSGDASTTDFTMSKSANVNAVRVVVENVVQNPTVAYTCSGTTLSFTSAPPTGTNNIYVVHLGPPAATIAPPTTINNATTFTGGVTFKNGSPEDTDGGRESILTFKGVQSGEEESTLAQIQAAHDGSSDDEKGLISFRTNDGNDSNSPTERWRITSDGHFKAMSSGLGIDFSVTSDAPTGTMSSELFSDYEEGTFTTGYADSSGNQITNTTSAGGIYRKIGNTVTIMGSIRTQGSSSVGSASGDLRIIGLPFTSINDTNAGMVTFYTNQNSGVYNAPSELPRASPIVGNSTQIQVLKYSGSGGRSANFQVSDLNMSGNSNFMFFGGSYLTS